jgi:RimJ/RimL family protein N-acetyltransferase
LLDATMTLATGRLRFERLAAGDAPDLAAAMSDTNLYEFIGGEPPSVEEVAARIRRYIQGPPRTGDAWHNWAIRLGDTEDDPGRLVGHLQATVREHGRSVEIAWLVGTPWQGRGYAGEAAIALVEWLRSNGAGEAIAHIAPGHAASERVAARAGLSPTDVIEDGEVRWRLALDGPDAGRA